MNVWSIYFQRRVRPIKGTDIYVGMYEFMNEALMRNLIAKRELTRMKKNPGVNVK